MDSLYLSPHLDDAVFSCGGRIAQQVRDGLSVTVITALAGDPPRDRSTFALRLGESAGLSVEEAVAERRREDVRALEILGAEVIHWPLLDCIYRTENGQGRWLYTSLASIFADEQPGDMLAGEVAERLAELPESGELVVPLGVGRHIDHRVIRRGAESLGRELLYWEDFPYVTHWRSRWRMELPSGPGWQSETVSLDDDAIVQRCFASAAYESQVALIFKNEQRLNRTLRRLISKRGGERYWRQAGTQDLSSAD
jgi:LmbE family N-acetylglucosaminyl deacetylase